MPPRQKLIRLVIVLPLVAACFYFFFVAPARSAVIHLAYAPIQFKNYPAQTPTPTIGPNSVFVLDSDSSYTNSIGVHILGEVFNNTPYDLAYVGVRANLYNSTGKYLTSDWTYPMATNLASGQKTCFDLTIDSPPDSWRSYDFGIVSYEIGQGPPAGLALLSINKEYDPASGHLTLDGEIKNNSSGTINMVKAVGTLYRVGGKVVGCSSEYISGINLAAGKKSTYRIEYSDRNYSNVTDFRVQVDGIPVKP